MSCWTRANGEPVALLAPLHRAARPGETRSLLRAAGLIHAAHHGEDQERPHRRLEVVSGRLPLVQTNAPDQVLDALGDRTRREIFTRLASGPSAVGELAGMLPVSRPAVSQHLKILKEAGLVLDTRDGARRIYQIDPEGLAPLREYLEGFWNRSLASFKTAIETREEHQ